MNGRLLWLVIGTTSDSEGVKETRAAPERRSSPPKLPYTICMSTPSHPAASLLLWMISSIKHPSSDVASVICLHMVMYQDVIVFGSMKFGVGKIR